MHLVWHRWTGMLPLNVHQTLLFEVDPDSLLGIYLTVIWELRKVAPTHIMIYNLIGIYDCLITGQIVF